MGIFDPDITSLEPKWQRQMRQTMTYAAQPGATERLARAGEAYPGQLTAPMTAPEQTSQNMLSKWLGGEGGTESPLYGMAESEMSKTLGGEYDPAASEYYKAFRNAVMRELQQAKDRLANQFSARDRLFGGGVVSETGKLEEGGANQLATILGQLAQQERQNRLAVAQGVPAFVSGRQQAALTPIAAAQQYGALPRTVEQAGLDAQYQEWLRQLNDLGIPLDLYTELLTYQAPTSVGASPWEQYAKLVSGAAEGAGKGAAAAA
jgi:hypothetical protein